MWPTHFPKNCPVGGEKQNIEVYRLVDNNPPTEADFISAFELQPTRKFGDICKACGLSVYRDLEEAKVMNEQLAQSTYFRRKGLPKKKIAVGRTDPNCGLIKATPSASEPESSHMTYWVYQGKRIDMHFEVKES